jgi:hypothetical protein
LIGGGGVGLLRAFDDNNELLLLVLLLMGSNDDGCLLWLVDHPGETDYYLFLVWSISVRRIEY